MILTFTGTQKGMTGDQAVRVVKLLLELSPSGVIHGNCINADEQFAELVHIVLGVKQFVHPGYPPRNPSDDSRNAHVELRWPDEVFLQPAKPFMVRNELMVVEGDGLLATPAQRTEVTAYSGTWATIRRARKFDRPHWLVWPDGSHTYVRGDGSPSGVASLDCAP